MIRSEKDIIILFHFIVKKIIQLQKRGKLFPIFARRILKQQIFLFYFIFENTMDKNSINLNQGSRLLYIIFESSLRRKSSRDKL